MPGITGCGEIYADWCGYLGIILEGLARLGSSGWNAGGTIVDDESWG